MSTADIVGNYVSRLMGKRYGCPIYVKEKGERRDEIVRRIVDTCKVIGVETRVLSPARVFRVKPTTGINFSNIKVGIDPALKLGPCPAAVFNHTKDLKVVG